ncbi:HAD family hydrolase [Roseitranquillus sediminis]|uniref:HAD family hydrolase n=1 Tax=Roseitranquillus sediminis TaxID=2809051 RepID=UPI001D0BFFDE|nr:HAD-IA family hydrolase [Roseitranquillus sediminis]MBM9595577.1 HAD-IA family hydrolase [Roseitranquillus sediminis]
MSGSAGIQRRVAGGASLELAALLFDLDGTLLATDDLHYEVFADLGRLHGVGIDRARYDAEIQGRMNAAIFASLFPSGDAPALADAKEAEFRRRLATAGAQPLPGLPDLLEWAAQRRLRTAVVTNAPRINADAMLAAIGLAGRFDTIVIAEECARGKPDPLPYLTAMRRIGVAPEGCVAFEDSRSGIRSACAAGARVVGLRTSLDAAALEAAGAGLAIGDFTDPALWDLLDKGRQTEWPEP